MAVYTHPSQGQRDFEARYPHLTTVVNQLCLAQGGELPWCVTGVSALIWDGEGLWLELAKPKHWITRPDGVIEIGLGGIGGSLEPGESLDDCWQRESLEEISVTPVLQSATATALVYEEGLVELVPALDDDTMLPLLLTISANRSRRERLPGCPTLAIVTYWARLDQEPRRSDLYGLVRLSDQSLAIFLSRPETAWHWQTLLEDLPEVHFDGRELPPANAIIRPVWTLRSLQLMLEAGILPKWRG